MKNFTIPANLLLRIMIFMLLLLIVLLPNSGNKPVLCKIHEINCQLLGGGENGSRISAGGISIVRDGGSLLLTSTYPDMEICLAAGLVAYPAPLCLLFLKLLSVVSKMACVQRPAIITSSQLPNSTFCMTKCLNCFFYQ